MDVITALQQRQATRAFLDRPVEDAQIQALLDAARWTPSGVNMQPWQLAVVRGASLQRLSDALIAAHEAGAGVPDYRYYPEHWREPYRERRKRCGLALYQALDIQRGEAERQKQAWQDNYRFFGAPLALLLFCDRDLGEGRFIDMGMFMQSLLLAAQAQGLASCPQAALVDYADVVREVLNIEDTLHLVGSIALGYADPNAAANGFRTERMAADEFTRWYS